MTNQVNVVIEMSSKITVNTLRRTTGVFDELTLGHFVLDMWTTQINGEHYERVAK